MSVLTTQAPTHAFQPSSYVAVTSQRARWATKRVLDVVVATLVMVATLPFVLVAIAAIAIDSRGNPLFSQIRIGAGGRPFRIYKLRTMTANISDDSHRAFVRALRSRGAEGETGMSKPVNDPRVTTVGRVLRRWSIDEVPQLWNVIRGDMSVVGPRPPLPYEATEWPGQHWLNSGVRPGLTGLWQVSGRAELPYECRFELDGEYCERWTLGLDLAIILRTPLAIAAGRGVS